MESKIEEIKKILRKECVGMTWTSIENTAIAIEKYFSDKITETPLMIATIIRCQELLADYVRPESNKTQTEIIDDLIGVLDDRKLLMQMKGLDLIS